MPPKNNESGDEHLFDEINLDPKLYSDPKLIEKKLKERPTIRESQRKNRKTVDLNYPENRLPNIDHTETSGEISDSEDGITFDKLVREDDDIFQRGSLAPITGRISDEKLLPEDPIELKRHPWYRRMFGLDDHRIDEIHQQALKRLLDKEKNKMEQAPKNNDVVVDVGQPEILPPLKENIHEDPTHPLIHDIQSEVVEEPTVKESTSSTDNELRREQEFLAKVKKQESPKEKGPVKTFTDAIKNLTEMPPKVSRNPEETEHMAKKAEGAGISLSPLEKFSLNNQSLWSKMKEGARNIAKEFYDKAWKFPLQKTVGKMCSGFNEFMADWNEKAAVKFKGKIDAIEIKKDVYDSTKQEMENLLVELKAQGATGGETLMLKIRDIEDQKRKLDNQKDTIQTKFEKFDNKTKLWTERRDNIADKLIGNYDEKLKPMEGKLDELKSCQDQLDLLESATQIKHDNETERLNNLSQKIGKIEAGLKLVGTDSGEIRKILKPLTEQVLAGTEKIRLAKEELANKRMAINKAIAKADARANPYRDNREQFIRIKDRRPIDMPVEKRETGPIFNKNTKIESGNRPVSESSSTDDDSNPFETEDESDLDVGNLAQWTSSGTDQWDSPKKIIRFSGDKKFAFFEGSNTGLPTDQLTKIEKAEAGEVPPKITPETIKNPADKLKTSAFIESWNQYLKTKKTEVGIIKATDFVTLTKMSDSYELTEKQFKTMLGNYLKYKKIPDTNLKGFLSKKK